MDPQKWHDDVLAARAIVAQKTTARDEASGEVESAKAKLKGAQIELEMAFTDLTDTIDGKDQGKLDFSDPTDWRTEPTTCLIRHGITPVIVEILKESKLAKVGDLAAWTNDSKLLTDIPHIGEAKAKAIEDALESFFASREIAE